MRSYLLGSCCLALSLISALPFGAVSAQDELKVGDPAPDFTLQASDGKEYRLSDFRGKQAVVLAWFPRAFTSGCTVECKSLAENGDLLHGKYGPRGEEYRVRRRHGSRLPAPE